MIDLGGFMAALSLVVLFALVIACCYRLAFQLSQQYTTSPLDLAEYQRQVKVNDQIEKLTTQGASIEYKTK